MSSVFVENVRARRRRHTCAHAMADAHQLAFDASDSDIIERFRAAGDVAQFRPIMDPSTGRSRGAGFVDFVSPEGAQAAVRLLHGSLMGGRPLRVAPAEQGARDTGGIKQQRDIEAALAQLSINDVYDVLLEFREWAAKDHDGVRDLLAQKPVVAQALLKMQIQMGMLHTPPPLDSSYGAMAPQQPQQPPPSGYAPMPQPPQHYAPPHGYAPQLPPMRAHPAMYQPPPPSDQRAYAALFQQALSMTEQQISAYPPQQQQIFRQLRFSAGLR